MYKVYTNTYLPTEYSVYSTESTIQDTQASAKKGAVVGARRHTSMKNSSFVQLQ